MKRSLTSTFFIVALLAVAPGLAQAPANVTRTEDVIYGRKFGTALTLDVFEPERKNGAAVFWIVSGGWFSSHSAIKPGRYKPLLDRGYTVFAVVHGEQPRFIVPEIVQDIHRAVRFVRHNAGRWGIDPDKFGVTGGSAGGHLALSIGTQGGPGPADAKDPIDRVTSAVQAVACFYPPTDLLNWSKPGEDFWDFERTRRYAPALGPRWETREGRQSLGREISPIHFVTARMPPTLIIQGDADTVVPLYQAQRFEQRCKEAGAPFALSVRPGSGHGGPGFENDGATLADWFDRHLRGVTAGN